MRPTPQPGQRFSSSTAAAGPAGDETNDPTSAGTTSNIKTANTQTAIREGDANLGSTSDGAGPLLFGDRLLLLDSQLSLAGADAVSEGSAGWARVASRDRHNAIRSPRSRWANSPYRRIRTSPLGTM